MKYLLLTFLIITGGLSYSQQRPAKMQFNDEIKVDDKEYVLWYGFMIDSSYLNVWLSNGELPRRENRTYKYWMVDSSGQLLKRITIGYRFPIFRDNPADAFKNSEGSIFEEEK